MNLATILTLERPLASLDLETTGLNTDVDRVVQIGVTMHYPHKDPVPWKSLVNPGVPMPRAAMEVHGIEDAHVKEAPTFAQICNSLAKALTGVDFTGANVKFDLKMLRAEMHRAGVKWDWEDGDAAVLDVLQIYRIKEPHSLARAFKRFVNQEGHDAHDAGADVAAADEVLAAQLEEFPDLPRDVRALAEFCFPVPPGCVDRGGKLSWVNGEACVNFGKWRGTPLRLVDRGYLDWMIKNDFPTDTKTILKRALGGDYPSKA